MNWPLPRRVNNSLNLVRNNVRLTSPKLWPFSVFFPSQMNSCLLAWFHMSVLSTSAESCTLRALNSQLRRAGRRALLKPLELLFRVMWGDGFQRARWTMPLPLPSLAEEETHYLAASTISPTQSVWKSTVRFRLSGAPDDLRYPFANSQILKPQSFCFYLTASTFSSLPGNSAQLWWTGLQTYPNK